MAMDIGAAVGANPIAIIIPCHRALGAKGELKGYPWGLHRKRWLLVHETSMEASGSLLRLLPNEFPGRQRGFDGAAGRNSHAVDVWRLSASAAVFRDGHALP
jgi:hypothetical protein